MDTAGTTSPTARPTTTLAAAFYGDDFTGSTDALTQFHRFGLRSVLVFQRPDGALLRQLATDYDVVGVAGVARSLPSAQMDTEVGPVLEALREARPQLVQYKMCSTADSSPTLGSLGRAVEMGREVFGAAPVPILAAQPEFGRYTAFGHHFAVDHGVTYRLDRQPTMSQHPATPMTEADLARHVGQQTTLPVTAFDLTAYELPHEQARARYAGTLAERPGAVVFDAVTQEHTVRAAELMFAEHGPGPLYALGSGGLSYGAAAHLSKQGTGRENRGDPLAPTDSVLVVSGSCSGRTAEQIQWALDRDWAGFRVDVDSVGGVDTSTAALRQLRDGVLRAVEGGSPGVVVYTSLGSPSPPPTGAREAGADDQDPLPSIGRTLGYVVREALMNSPLRRVVVAGGDTSGRVVRELGVDAAEVDAVVGVGTVVCRLDSSEPGLGGAQVLLKGGQAGEVDLFDQVRRGIPEPDQTTPEW